MAYLIQNSRYSGLRSETLLLTNSHKSFTLNLETVTGVTMFKHILFSVALLAHFALFAEASQGEVLERKMWEYIRDHKWSNLEDRIAPYFQAAVFDRARNK